jgi:hypothetical protein
MISMERNPPPTRLLHNIERIQGWAMIIYCPLEAVSYLGAHSILPVSARTRGKMDLFGVRCWAVYVILQLLHLVEDNRLLRLRARALERGRGHPTPARTPNTEKKVDLGEEQETTRGMWRELDARKDAILNQLWVNLGYLPLTVHWCVCRAAVHRRAPSHVAFRCRSTPGGLLSDAWVGFFGTIAASAGLRAGWRATAKRPELAAK